MKTMEMYEKSSAYLQALKKNRKQVLGILEDELNSFSDVNVTEAFNNGWKECLKYLKGLPWEEAVKCICSVED